MSYCPECGEKLESDLHFCVHCGEAIDNAKENDAENDVEQGAESDIKEKATDMTKGPSTTTGTESGGTTDQVVKGSEQADVDPTIQPKAIRGDNAGTGTQQQVTARRPMSKKTKVIGGILIVLILALFGTYKGLEAYFNPVKHLQAMEEAVSKGDQDAFLSYIHFEKDALLDDASYFNYIREEEWNEVRKKYLAILESDMQGQNLFDQEITKDDGTILFKLKHRKRLWLYDDYELYAVPLRVNIYSDLPETTVKLLDQKWTVKDTNEPVESGSMYPGEYKVEAVAKGEYGDIILEKDKEVITHQDQEVHLSFDFVTVDIMSSYEFEDAYVYIDGEKTDFQLYDSTLLEPFPADKTVKLHAEWKNDKKDVVRSDTVEVNGDTDYYQVYFEFDDTLLMSEAVEEDLRKESDSKEDKGKSEDKETEGTTEAMDAGFFVLKFRDAYEYAVNDADYAEIKDYVKADSHADKELKKFIGDMEYGDYYYDFEENTVIDVEKTKDNNYKVKTAEKFTFIDKDSKTYDYNREKEYVVELEDDDFYITKIEYTDTKKNKKN